MKSRFEERGIKRGGGDKERAGRDWCQIEGAKVDDDVSRYTQKMPLQS